MKFGIFYELQLPRPGLALSQSATAFNAASCSGVNAGIAIGPP